MSLVQLIDIFYRRQRRVFLLVALGVFVGSAAVIATMTKEYRGVSTLFVGENRSFETGAGGVQLDDVLARTYAALLTTAETQRAVAARVPGTTPDELESRVAVEVVPGTRLLEIAVLDADPERARDLAITYAQVFVGAQERSLSRSAQVRLDRLSRQIGTLAAELDALRAGQAAETASRRAQIESELAALRQSFNALQESGVLQGNNVTVSSLAVTPSVPAKPRRKLLLVASLLLALLLGAGAALVRNFFDRRVRDEDELAEMLNAPILARIPEMRPRRDQRAVSEAFDFLRINLVLAAADRPARVIAVTSSLAGDGKSTVSARLARAFAQQGAEVVAADCDLRKPRLSSYLGVSRPQGITNVLVAGMTAGQVLTETEFHGVRVLPSGPVPPNPSVLLGLPRFAELVDELRTEADYVVLDTPPVWAGVETSTISQLVDGVVLVVDLNRSDRKALAGTRKQLDNANARILGIVLNRVTDSSAQYSYYEAPDPVSEPADREPAPARLR